MQLISVDQLPEKRWDKPTNKNLKQMLGEFNQSDSDIVRIETMPFEYASPESLCESVRRAISRTEYSFKVCRRGHDVYIIKED